MLRPQMPGRGLCHAIAKRRYLGPESAYAADGRLVRPQPLLFSRLRGSAKLHDPSNSWQDSSDSLWASGLLGIPMSPGRRESYSPRLLGVDATTSPETVEIRLQKSVPV